MKAQNHYIDVEKREGVGGWQSESHYHNFYEIYFMDSGSCNYFVDSKIYAVSQNDLVFIPPRTIHQTVYRNTDPHRRVLISFSGEYLAPPLIAPAKQLFRNVLYRPHDADAVRDILGRLYAEHRAGDAISDELVRCCMSELFAYCVRNPSTAEHVHTDAAGLIIERTAKYISENFSQNITLPALAEAAGYSETYFSRLFKAQTGFGCKEFILLVRLRAAKELLISSPKSVCEIAYECGFGDSNYFSSIFKKCEGITPVKYRRRYNS